MCSGTTTLLSLFRLAQISDSAFPVGSFSFSLGLEAAVAEGIVDDEASLEEFTRGALYSAAEGDGIALLEAYRAAEDEDFERLAVADRHIYAFKAAEENRAMSVKMGRRLAELLLSIAPCHLSQEVARLIRQKQMVGTYPAVQAVASVVLEAGEKALFAAHLYGVAATILSAALRLMRLSHFESQRILYRVGPLCQGLYERYSELPLDQMSSFAPTLELCTSLHEKGKARVFMN